MKFIIKIRFSCGTERYITGYGEGRSSVKWELDKPAYAWDNFEEADKISTGLNFNHMSSGLGGFSCVIAVDDKYIDTYVNPTKEEEQFEESYRLMKLREEVARKIEIGE